MNYNLNKKENKGVKIFWLIMVGITIILLGLKLCNVCNLYDILSYKLVFLPIYGPAAIALLLILWAVFVAAVKAIFNSIFKNK